MIGTQAAWLRRKRPTAETLGKVLGAMLDAEQSARELARTVRLPWRRVCAALDALLVRGAVEVDHGKYRRTNEGRMA